MSRQWTEVIDRHYYPLLRTLYLRWQIVSRADAVLDNSVDDVREISDEHMTALSTLSDADLVDSFVAWFVSQAQRKQGQSDIGVSPPTPSIFAPSVEDRSFLSTYFSSQLEPLLECFLRKYFDCLTTLLPEDFDAKCEFLLTVCFMEVQCYELWASSGTCQKHRLVDNMKQNLFAQLFESTAESYIGATFSNDLRTRNHEQIDSRIGKLCKVAEHIYGENSDSCCSVRKTLVEKMVGVVQSVLDDMTVVGNTIDLFDSFRFVFDYVLHIQPLFEELEHKEVALDAKSVIGDNGASDDSIRPNFSNLFHTKLQLDYVLQVFDVFIRASTIEKNQTKSSELADNLFRMLASNKGAYDSAMSWTLVFIVSCMESKDVVLERYRKLLSKRLFSKRLFSAARLSRSEWVDEHIATEAIFVEQLRSHFGFHSIMKNMTTMLSDVRHSSVLDDVYTSRENDPNCPLEVTVLTTFAWPSLSDVASRLELPEKLFTIRSHFASWYQNFTHSSRMLHWYPSMGKVLLVVQEAAHVWMTETMAAVLLLFNDKDTWTEQDMFEALQARAVPDREYVARSVESILRFSPVRLITRDASNALSYTMDGSIKRSSKKHMISLLAQSETMDRLSAPSQSAETEREVLEMRKHSIDALLVRIMKARKTIEWNTIVVQALEHSQSMFVPDIKFLKQRLEHLIEMDYIERDRERADVFHYVC